MLEQEAGTPTAEVCRKHGITAATFYNWKAKFGGMEVPETRQLKTLEDKNTRLKRLLADATLHGGRGRRRLRSRGWRGLEAIRTPVENPGQSVDRKAAELQMAALG